MQPNLAKVQLRNQAVNLSYYASVIRLMSPENILSKGFALLKVNGKITTNPENIEPGEQISIILAEKELSATVTTKKEYEG